MLAPDTLSILDAGYAQYKLLSEIIDNGSSVVIRLRDNAVWHSVEQRALTPADIQAGVLQDTVVYVGDKHTRADCPHLLRIIQVLHTGEPTPHRTSRVSSKKTFRTTQATYTLLLATNRMDLSAETIATRYRYRCLNTLHPHGSAMR